MIQGTWISVIIVGILSVIIQNQNIVEGVKGSLIELMEN